MSRQALTLRGAVTLGLAAALLALGVVYILQLTAQWLVSGQQTVDEAIALNDARTSVIQLVGGVALIGGLIFTARTYLLSRTTQRSDRFTKAIDQLGSGVSLGVRVGGVYSLEMIANEDPRYWKIIEQVLSSFIREKGVRGAEVSADIQAALNVLASRGDRKRQSWAALDLRGACLRGADCHGGNLSRALLHQAELDEANLADCDLTGAQLEGASLRKAVLSGSKLVRSSLKGSDLRSAEFLEADLGKADMQGARITGAKNLSTRQLASVLGIPKSD